MAPPISREALYHCQQAAEKALKGFLAFHDHPFRRTHDLRELGELCESFDATLRVILEPAYALAEFASRFRYPGAPYEPAIEEATEGLAQAELVCAEIMRRIPGGEADKLGGLITPR